MNDDTVVTSVFLHNPAVRHWLGGIVPAWTLLDPKSFEALRLPPIPPVGAIRLAADFSPDELGQSPVARNALVLLHSASTGPGLKLTSTGNLSRSVVAEMCDLFIWPGFDKAEAFQFHKVINEPGFLPLYFVRHLVETAGLVRQRKGYLKVTPAGRQVLEDPARQALQGLLFHLALWAVDLGYLGRGLHGDWPQRDAGVLLWSLSTAANDWESPQRLTRMCTIPIDSVLKNGMGLRDHGDGSKDSTSTMVVWSARAPTRRGSRSPVRSFAFLSQDATVRSLPVLRRQAGSRRGIETLTVRGGRFSLRCFLRRSAALVR